MNLPKKRKFTKPYNKNAVYLQIKQFTQTDDFSCGFACALTVTEYFNKVKSYSRLWKDIQVTEEGTAQTNLVKGLRKNGIRTSPRYRMTFDSYVKAIDDDKLVIVYNYSRDHWEVVYGYLEYPCRWLYVADSMPWKRDKRLWTNCEDYYRGYGILCSVKKEK